MELREFVSRTLGDVINGILDAQRAAIGTGAIISPGAEYTHKKLTAMGGGRHAPLSTIAFDVAVTSTESSGGKGEAGIRVAGIGAKGEREAQNSLEHATRIKFDIEVLWPLSDRDGPYIDKASPGK